MEKKQKNFKPFHWQLEAINQLCKKNNKTFTNEMRIAISVYIKSYKLNPLSSEQEDRVHYQALSFFTKTKNEQ